MYAVDLDETQMEVNDYATKKEKTIYKEESLEGILSLSEIKLQFLIKMNMFYGSSTPGV